MFCCLRLVVVTIATVLVAGCGIKPKGKTDKPLVNNKPVNYELIGGFRGYLVTNQVIKDRVIQEGIPFELAGYFELKENQEENIFSDITPNLRSLLGINEGNGVNSGYKNNQPNSINMLLWYIALSGLATDMADTCDDHSNLFNQKTDDILAKLCTWPEAESKSDKTLQELWQLLMDYDATNEEFLVWRAYVQSDEFSKNTKKEAILNMVVSILYNPYFLLK